MSTIHDEHKRFIESFRTKKPNEWTAWRRSNYDFFEIKLRDESHSKKLIDLGAGALHFKELFLRFDYVGVDFMEYPHVSIVADLTKDFPIPDDSADLAVASNTLEHIPNTSHFLSQTKRILKPGGRLIGTIPFLMPIHQAPYDFNRYTSFQLRRLLEEAGFHDIEVVPLGGQIDVYNTIELKVFDALYRSTKRMRFVLKTLRTWRRLEMAIIRLFLGGVPSGEKVTEGYGFSATA